MSLCGCDTRRPRPDLLFICHSALFYGFKWKHNMDVWRWLYRSSMNHQLIQWHSTYQAYSFTFKRGPIWTKKWSLLFLRLTCEARNECVFNRWSKHPNLLENLWVLCLEMFLHIHFFYHWNAFIADQTFGLCSTLWWDKLVLLCPLAFELGRFITLRGRLTLAKLLEDSWLQLQSTTRANWR